MSIKTHIETKIEIWHHKVLFIFPKNIVLKYFYPSKKHYNSDLQDNIICENMYNLGREKIIF